MSISLSDVFENEFYVLDYSGDLFFADEFKGGDENFQRLLDREVFSKSVAREK